MGRQAELAGVVERDARAGAGGAAGPRGGRRRPPERAGAEGPHGAGRGVGWARERGDATHTAPLAPPAMRPAAAPPRVPGTPIAPGGAPVPPLQRAAALLFKFPPVLAAGAAKARRVIKDKGLAIGVDVDAEAAALAASRDWDAARAALESPSVSYPAYYLKPFHCYADGPGGNLCWDAAWQAYAAAAAVHASAMSPPGAPPAAPRADGDAALRASFSDAAATLMRAAGVDPTALATAVDAGCSVGLSTRELARAFPSLRAIVGVDLSPHMLAVAEATAARGGGGGGGASLLVEWRHAAAEATGLPDASADLVSICLVLHELPAAATEAVFKEAWRVLKPGGVVAAMDQDTGAPAFAALLANPAAFAGFSASEPWLSEYMGVDARAVAAAAGFEKMATAQNSPRHFTLVAVKPAA